MSARSRHRSFAAVAAAFSAAVFSLSCWVPSYDPAISLSAKFEKKLEKVARIGPAFFEGDYSIDAGYFVPHSEARPLDGYWVRVVRDAIHLRYVRQEGTTARIGISWNAQYALGESFNAVSSLSAAAAATFSPMARGAMILGSGTMPLEALLGLRVGMDSSLANIGNAPILSLFPSAPNRILGGSRSPLPGSQDHVAILFADYAPSFKLLGGHAYFDRDAAYPVLNFNTMEYATLYTGEDFRGGVFFAYDGTGYILSGIGKTSGAPITLRWSGGLSGPPTPLPIDAQITNILSDGTLVAREDALTKFYSASGAPKYSVQTGALRFIHEYYDPVELVWYSYFTRTLLIKKDEAPKEFYADVFRFPTARLAELAQP